MRKNNLKEVAFDQILLRLDDVPDEDRNEVHVFLVGLALGYPLEATRELTGKDAVELSYASKLSEACLSIGDVVGLEQVEPLILHWTILMALGKPIDDRWRGFDRRVVCSTPEASRQRASEGQPRKAVCDHSASH